MPDFEKYTLASGDILLNEASGSPNEVGKPAIWRNEIEGCCFQNTLLRLRPQFLNRDYLYWYCYASALAGRFGEAGRGVNIRHLGKRGLAQFPIPIAPLAEQSRIVTAIEEHFSRLDAADGALAAAPQKIDALRRSAAVDLFDPPDWTWTTLGEIAELKGGVTKDSKREADPGYVEYPYLRVANVQRGFLDLSGVTTIRADRNKAERLFLQRGDILFNEGGDRDKLGRGWVWEGPDRELHPPESCVPRTPDQRRLRPVLHLHARQHMGPTMVRDARETDNQSRVNQPGNAQDVPSPGPLNRRTACGSS